MLQDINNREKIKGFLKFRFLISIKKYKYFKNKIPKLKNK